MCGIVGLFAKTPEVEAKLGEHLSAMLIEMTDRGPDSAGVAVYRNPVAEGALKLSLHSADPDFSWSALARELAEELGDTVDMEVRGSHAVVVAHAAGNLLRSWLAHKHPDLAVVSAGAAIEIFKEMGLPQEVVDRFELREISGSHAIGHTRMATESVVTTEHSHPFSTGEDLCLVHNGSLSNHNRLRQRLRRRGIEFQTDNDSEVAAGFFVNELRNGASLREALEAGLRELDGFFTFAVGTRNGFAVVRDGIACKPAVLAETDDWVAMASEFRSIAQLPGANEARMWEPAPGKIYVWGSA
ncbi:MAG: amidophosphoribosyltransferase [Pseudomonadota bacterium]